MKRTTLESIATIPQHLVVAAFVVALLVSTLLQILAAQHVSSLLHELAHGTVVTASFLVTAIARRPIRVSTAGGATARPIRVGTASTTAAGAVRIAPRAERVTAAGATASPVRIASTGAATGSVRIAAASATGSVRIAATSAAAGAVRVASARAARGAWTIVTTATRGAVAVVGVVASLATAGAI